MKKTIFFLVFAFSFCAFAEDLGRTLLDQEVVVVRSDFREFHFLIPEKLQGDWIIRGRYLTSGGFNDDITFLALNQENYVRWFSHYKYDALVRDEKRKDGHFQFEAKHGETYYFVLYNFFSTISNKRVRLKIELLPKP